MLQKVIATLTFLLSAQLMAHESVPVVSEVNFNFSSNRSYYACSYAEAKFATYVEKMGGSIEKIRCYGGLPDSSMLRIVADVQHWVAANEDSKHNWIPVNISGNEACSFNKKMVMTLLSTFSTRGLEARDTCWYSEGRYSYNFEVLAE